MFEVVESKYRENKQVTIHQPERGTQKACAYDIFSPCSCIIPVGCYRMIWTDVKVKLEDDQVCLLNVRSSMGKHQIMLANTQGWIDADYYGNAANDGNIGVNLYNF